jgi:hypothetical protein
LLALAGSFPRATPPSRINAIHFLPCIRPSKDDDEGGAPSRRGPSTATAIKLLPCIRPSKDDDEADTPSRRGWGPSTGTATGTGCIKKLFWVLAIGGRYPFPWPWGSWWALELEPPPPNDDTLSSFTTPLARRRPQGAGAAPLRPQMGAGFLCRLRQALLLVLPTTTLVRLRAAGAGAGAVTALCPGLW